MPDEQSKTLRGERPRYKIGNFLRGFIYFSADDDKQAWEIGQALFNAHFPSKSGRVVTLLSVPVPCIREGATKIKRGDKKTADANPHEWYAL